MGTTRIYLFDNNLNLGQGRHIFKLNKIQFENKEINSKNLKIEENFEREDQLDSIGKEIDSLINSFYDKEKEFSKKYRLLWKIK